MNFRGRYNFPQWNYGYTLGPPCPMGNGDYNMMFPNPYGGGYGPQPGFTPLGRGAKGMRPFRGRGRGARGAGGRGGGNQSKTAKKQSEESETKLKGEATEGGGEEKEQQQQKEVGEGNNAVEEQEGLEEGEMPEVSLDEVLKGRNPIMYCNDNSKFRGLRMEWEQISETGPPHDKTFTWSLKMGDELMTYGSANSKKLAKTKAAEEMVLKLAKLPRVQKRSYQQMSQGSYNNMPPPPQWMMRGGRGGRMMRGRGRGGRGMRGGPKKAKLDGQQQHGEEVAGSEGEPAAKMPSQQDANTNQSQNNPISKLYEYTKRRKLPEPIFEIVSENVLDTKRTSQGFTLKRTEFTMRCSLQGKEFFGTGMTKKQAKHDSASSAWAEFGAGVGQKSIDNFLQEHKNA